MDWPEIRTALSGFFSVIGLTFVTMLSLSVSRGA
jgi:hypothetical protein